MSWCRGGFTANDIHAPLLDAVFTKQEQEDEAEVGELEDTTLELLSYTRSKPTWL
jgi:hypothetical protein